jgi:5'-3' exonuclease
MDDNDVDISGSDVAGEAEIKICNFIKSQTNANQDTCLIVGEDSDLLLLGKLVIR